MNEIFYLIVRLINAYELIIFIWVIMGWLQMFGALPYSRPLHVVMDLLFRITDPYLGLFRRFLPPMGGMDLSPLVGIIALELLKILLSKIML